MRDVHYYLLRAMKRQDPPGKPLTARQIRQCERLAELSRKGTETYRQSHPRPRPPGVGLSGLPLPTRSRPIP